MDVEPKDLFTWGGTIVAMLAQWFHLKGRVAIIEAVMKRDQETFKEALERIDNKLDSIERKLDRKADK